MVLGTVYQEQGKLNRATACYQKHMHLQSAAGIEVKAALLLPVICESTRSIVDFRKTISSNIEKLNHKDLHLKDPSREIGKTNFFLAYHGLNNRDLQEKIAPVLSEYLSGAWMAGIPETFPQQQ